MQETQDCLRNQNCDSAKTNAGIAADQKALDAVGGNSSHKQELYNISADIMTILVQKTGGDPAKMQVILEKAQSDPEGFMKLLPLGLQTRINNSASALEKNQTAGQGQ